MSAKVKEKRQGYATRVVNTVSSTQLLRVVILSVFDANGSAGSYGYEALKVVKKMVGEDEDQVLESGVWTPSHGSLYRALRELKADGFIEEIKKPYSGNVKFYVITEEGKKELERTLHPLLGNLKATSELFANITKSLIDINNLENTYDDLESRFTERVDPASRKGKDSHIFKLDSDYVNNSIIDISNDNG